MKGAKKIMGNKVYQIITDKIIERLEKGEVSWQKGWTGKKINYVSRKSYRGINLLLLKRAGEYLTWNQIQNQNGRVKKGAKSEMIIYYKTITKNIEEENKEGKMEKAKRKIPLLRYYRVFHLDDTEGIESKLELEEHDPIVEAETLIDNITDKPKISIKYSDRAFYQPKTDKVTLPLKEQFEDIEEFYSTFFHELAHSTGHKKRLNRFSNKTDQFIFASRSYSKEELVAEIAAAMICAECGINTEKTLDNSAGYIGGWLKKLKNDKKLIVQAGNKAQKIMDFIKKGRIKEYKTA
jgi:antirestriction protein ArdC